jgi:predicted PurR-regulated permease PerM
MSRRDTPEGPSARLIFRIVITISATLLFLYAVYLVRSVLVLVVVAGFLAVGLDPAVRRLQTWGLKRGQAVAAILVGTIIFIVAFFAAVVPPLVEQVTHFATNLPHYVQDIAHHNPRIQQYVTDHDLADRLRESTSKVPTALLGSFGTVVGVAGSVLGAIFKAVTVIVLTLYFSNSLDKIKTGSLKLVPASKRERFEELAEPILLKIGGYIAGNIGISLIAGALAFAFLAIARVPFPVALALWVAIADLIPLVGASLGAIPAIIVAFFGSVPLGIATIVYFIVYQQAENYFIAPRVMNKAVDLSPAAVLLSALIGASLLGVLGALMAIPAAAAIKLLVQELVVPEAAAS